MGGAQVTLQSSSLILAVEQIAEGDGGYLLTRPPPGRTTTRSG